MSEKFNQIKYKNQYDRDHYDNIHIIAPKGQKERIKAMANSKGISVSKYLLDLIEKDMEDWNEI